MSECVSVIIFISDWHFRINKESIVDIEAQVTVVPQPVEACTQRDVELSINQIWVVSSAVPQLPLLIEDASRPEKSDVCLKN